MDTSIIKQLFEDGQESLALEALNNLPAVVEIKNRDLITLFINDVGCLVSGYHRDHIVGKNCLEFIPQKDHAKFIESTSQLFKEGHVKRLTHILNSEGKVFSIMSSAKVIKYQGTEYSQHTWFEVTGFPELYEIVDEKNKAASRNQIISPKIASLYRDQVIHYLVDEGHFTDTSLTLLDMSVRLGIQQKYISRIIKTEFGLGFNDFMNYLRLREFHRLQINPESRRFTRESIANSAGFPSAPTFYRAQKKLGNLSISIPKGG